MKVFLTIELFAFILILVGNWLYWFNTHDWTTDNDGWTSHYLIAAKYKAIRLNCNYAGFILMIIGFICLIWFGNF